jgi:peptidylprolyl isomerase
LSKQAVQKMEAVGSPSGTTAERVLIEDCGQLADE